MKYGIKNPPFHLTIYCFILYTTVCRCLVKSAQTMVLNGIVRPQKTKLTRVIHQLSHLTLTDELTTKIKHNLIQKFYLKRAIPYILYGVKWIWFCVTFFPSAYIVEMKTNHCVYTYYIYPFYIVWLNACLFLVHMGHFTTRFLHSIILLEPVWENKM